MARTDHQVVPWEKRIVVEVLQDGAWHAGELVAERCNDHRWEAYVRYTVTRGDVRAGKVGWFTYDHIRPA